MNTARTTDEAIAADETAPSYITKQDVINLWKSRYEAAYDIGCRLDREVEALKATNADLLAALKGISLCYSNRGHLIVSAKTRDRRLFAADAAIAKAEERQA